MLWCCQFVQLNRCITPRNGALTDVYFPSQGEGLPLLSGEKKEIEELLPATTSEEDKDTIFSILGQAMCRPTGIQVFTLYLCVYMLSLKSPVDALVFCNVTPC